jgi:hypothetical protein
MPTQAYFDKFPPFPSDVQVANLPRISFSKLLGDEKGESDALFEACRAMGFFLLDFEGCAEGETFLEKTEAMFDLNQEVSSLDDKELMKYSYQLPSLLR